MPRRASFLAIPVIGGLILGVYAGCAVLGILLGLPWDVGLPWPVRLLSLPFLVFGLGMIAWVFQFRRPGAVLDSTWVTFRKLIGREPLASQGGRTEPLVVAGPYRLVRHPLYSGVDALVLGIGLLVDHPWAYLAAVVLWAWFAFVLAPFEERELFALFGPPYEAYMRTHWRFVPLPRRGT